MKLLDEVNANIGISLGRAEEQGGKPSRRERRDFGEGGIRARRGMGGERERKRGESQRKKEKMVAIAYASVHVHSYEHLLLNGLTRTK